MVLNVKLDNSWVKIGAINWLCNADPREAWKKDVPYH